VKDILAFLLLFPLFTYFTWQPVQTEVNNAKIVHVDAIVHTALSEAKIKGYFSPEDLQTIQQTVAEDLGYPEGAVSVQGTQTPQTRGQPVSLTVTIPLRLQFLNIYGANNTQMYTHTETQMSEALTP
jgi:peptidoglycan hydrolase-like protein with peptidoglycan-binding domain